MFHVISFRTVQFNTHVSHTTCARLPVVVVVEAACSLVVGVGPALLAGMVEAVEVEDGGDR